MNTITKIGQMALARIFERKTSGNEARRYTVTVTFSESEVDLTLTPDDVRRKFCHESLAYGKPIVYIWSIDLGLIELDLKQGQSLLKGMIRKLSKLQKDRIPSHVIIKTTQKVNPGGVVSIIDANCIIFRLSDDQDQDIYIDLMPSIMKRENALHQKIMREIEEEKVKRETK